MPTSAAGTRTSAVENFCRFVVRVSRMSKLSVLSPSTTVYRNVNVVVMFPLKYAACRNTSEKAEC